jgi:hypothetical protein
MAGTGIIGVPARSGAGGEGASGAVPLWWFLDLGPELRIRELLRQRTERGAAMRDRVLAVGVHLGGRAPVRGVEEDRVVAEAVLAPRFVDEVALDPPLGLDDHARLGAGDGDREAALEVRERLDDALLVEASEQEVEVLQVGRLLAGVAGGADAGLAVEGRDDEAGVVREARGAEERGVRERLDRGVLAEGGAGLGDIREVDGDDGADAQRREDLPHLDELLRVLASDEDHSDPPQNRRIAEGLRGIPVFSSSVLRFCASAVCPLDYFPSRARRWRLVISATPRRATRKISSSTLSSNGCDSAVPCTSMYFPSPVIATFRSTSAFESSS